MDATSFTRSFAKSCFAFLIAGTVFAGPLTGPIDPTLPIDLPPTKPALPGLPSVDPIMINSMLGFMISTPIMAFDNTGSLTYNAGTNLLSVDADPLAILLNNVDPPTLVFPGSLGANFTINIEVDSAGNLIGGVPGDDLVITGAVDLTGDFIPDIDGVLLTGEITEYMGEDSGGTTDFHAYRFNVTGGFLAGPFGSDVAVELTSEMSDFTGSYTVDFSGEAKGDIGVVECTGTIGDYIWLDLDGNGIQDDGEFGLPNIQVILTDQFGNETTTVTNSNGFYQFGDLCAGTYTVSVNPDSLPLDARPTLINAPGSNSDNDSNDHDGTQVTLPGNNSSDQTIDFGYAPAKASLGDYVWEDLNMDGIQDSNEPGVEGVTVNLYNCEGEFLDTTTTTATGFYKFTELPAGCYQVEFILPDGFVFTIPGQNGDTLDSDADPTTGFSDPVFLDTFGNNQDIDAGIYRPATAALGDYVWEDLNMDGIQDSNEPGVEGVMVNLYNCEGEFIASDVTDEFGAYFFDNLPAGCYQVEFILPPDFVFTLMDQNGETLDSDPDPTTGLTDPVFLSDGETNPDVDAGMFRPATAELGDRFWEDLNGNGIQDPGEPGIEGVTVNLYDCSGNLLDSTTTGVNGDYLFPDLAEGCYVVGFEPPDMCVLTAQDAGIDDADDSDADPNTGLTGQIDLADGQSDLTWDAGCYYTAGLGDFVWNDLNQDGIQDDGEPGIEGLLVLLLDADMMSTGLVDTTGPNGEYEFTGLPPGSYFVQFSNPPGFVFSPQDQGADDADDSDANGTGKTDKITLESGEFDPTIDAGVYVPDDPSISIEKSTNGFDADDPTGPFIPTNDPVLWEYFVENTGNVTLTNVMVTDDQGVMVTCPQTTLEPGDTMTCTGMGDATVDQYENLGTVSGDPPQGPPETAEDPSHYFGADPSIDIEKATNGVDADDPTGPFITPGAAVSWTYVVHNTGNVTLTDVMVTDDQGVMVMCPLTTLIPDQIMTCNAEGIAVIGQYANVGSVVGTPPDGAGPPQTDEDPSHYFGATPGIHIEKATNGFDADSPTGPFIAVGDDVNWTYVVSNTGNVELTNVVVTDDQGAVVDCGGNSVLAPMGEPGDSFECTASGTALIDQYQNIGTVTGDPPTGAGPQQTDTDPSHYYGSNPVIDLEKLTNGEDADTPTGPIVPVGSTVTWTYIITNMGNVALSNITLTDTIIAPLVCNEGPIPTLDVGENFICTVTGIAEAGQYMNRGDTCGTDPTGIEVCDDDPSHYLGAMPSIDIEKATNGEDADTPTGPFVATGGAVTWTYVVTNTGNVDLTNVVVTDNQGVAVDCMGQNTLAANGGTFTCTANGTAQAGQYANIGSVVGTPPDGAGPPVDDSDPSHYFGANPVIDIEKLTNGEQADTPTGPIVAVGSTVTWTYIITNMGNVALSDITLDDSVFGPVTCNEGPIPTLNPGNNFICTVMGIAQAGQYMNRGDTCGTDPTGVVVCDDDPSHYLGADPSIDIEKLTNGEQADDPTGPLIETGGAVVWTYIVHNDGNVPLTNVTVTDDQGVMVSCPQDTLAVDETMECTANGTAQAGQYANVGDVVGTPPVGPLVRDLDPSHYFGVTPGINIEKLTNDIDADDPNAGDAPQILPGDPVTWTYIVTNTGNVALSGVVVGDSQGVMVDCMGQNSLAPAGQLGDTFTCTASGFADDLMTAAGTVPGMCGGRPDSPLYENTGLVVGTTPLGAEVTDSDDSHYCNPEVCALAVNKTCLIPMPPASNYVCDTPIDSLTMIYTGTQPIRIIAWKGDVGSTMLADIDDIQPGEEVTVMGFAGSPNDVYWEVFLAGTDSKIGESNFHLSCSDDAMDGPEDCGLPQGDGKGNDSSLLNIWELEGIVDAGGTLDCTPPATTGVSDCEFQTFPASCETGDADFLTFQYTGGSCLESSNSQDDHVCSGSVDGGASATFTDDDGNSVTLNPGETVTIPRNLAKNMTLSNAGGTQTNVMHTSCSQPIVAGDVYGGLTLVQIDGMGIGTDVIYTYEISNTSDVDIVSLMAIDNVLGPIPGAPSSLAANTTIMLNASAFITETTMNTAIVDGDTADGQMCNGTSSATVTILPPPPCDVDGEGLLDVSSDKIKWNLTNNGAFTATIESVEISWPNANGDLIEVKFDGDKIWEGNRAAPSTTFNSGDWINDLHKRQIPPGDTDTLEIKFDNNVVGPQDAYSITVNFEEGCSVTFENTGLPFECNTDITELTMRWDGTQTIDVRAWYGDVGSTLLHTQNNVTPGTEVTVSGYADSQNDVYWEVLSGGTVIGESNFHMSCSDNEMNGAEDCGNRQGNGKGNDSGLINDWILEGMVDADGPFDCSDLP